MPHGFEKGLDNVTAVYKLRDDGKIDVTNVGIKNGEKSEAKAIAWIGEKECPGRLFVSFFRPIKSEYNIIKLDEKNYDYAVVTSSSKKYLWILAEPQKLAISCMMI